RLRVEDRLGKRNEENYVVLLPCQAADVKDSGIAIDSGQVRGPESHSEKTVFPTSGTAPVAVLALSESSLLQPNSKNATQSTSPTDHLSHGLDDSLSFSPEWIDNNYCANYRVAGESSSSSRVTSTGSPFRLPAATSSDSESDTVAVPASPISFSAN